LKDGQFCRAKTADGKGLASGASKRRGRAERKNKKKKKNTQAIGDTRLLSPGCRWGCGEGERALMSGT